VLHTRVYSLSDCWFVENGAPVCLSHFKLDFYSSFNGFSLNQFSSRVLIGLKKDLGCYS
ncbi:unnamed protein product, partial [Arabidopsis halleri]